MESEVCDFCEGTGSHVYDKLGETEPRTCGVCGGTRIRVVYGKSRSISEAVQEDETMWSKYLAERKK